MSSSNKSTSSFSHTPIRIALLPSRSRSPSTSPPSHHVGSPPTSFQNPWPSFTKKSLWEVFTTRFSSDRNFVPVPGREELVQIRDPDFGEGRKGMKVTWFGHASFLVETGPDGENGVGLKEEDRGGKKRGVRVLFDPVWSERTSPVQWFGPKRYTPVPCPISSIPDVDLVVISHNHYDHLDSATIRSIYSMRKGHVHFFCPLGNIPTFLSLGIARHEVTELDWWQGVRIDVAGVGAVKLTCTPAQHFSGRAGYDNGKALWGSWVLEEICSDVEKPAMQSDPAPQTSSEGDVASTVIPQSDSEQQPSSSDLLSEPPPTRPRNLFFAGDTGYRTVPASLPTTNTVSDPELPACPAFSQIGTIFGPFSLALLPIGLYSPRNFMSAVHCAPEDAVCIHKDLKAKRSVGMHWGTVRGGLSGQYEDVREPPRRFREVGEREGLVWGRDFGLMEVGETVCVE